MKDTIIIITILLIVILGNVVTNKYLKKTAEILVNGLEELETNIGQINVTHQELIQKAENVYDNWKKINEKWSKIALHEEIDLIETSLIRVKSKIKTGNIDESIEDIETSIFLINHINEKEKICLKNIF